MKKLTYIISMALALCSCWKEQTPEEPERKGVQVTFNVTLPERVSMPTRAGTDTDVENIDLLIFNELNQFIERVSVDAITGSGANKSFTVVLDASNTARNIHIVANGRTSTNVDRINFSHITTGMSENVAIPALVTNPMTTASEDEMTPLVMWGRKLLPSISSSTTVSGIALLRNQAKIQVGKGVADASNGLANFEITSATLHSAPSSGKVTPFDNFTTNVPIAPNEVSTPRINYYTSNGYIATGANPVLYLYERVNTTADHLSLIIGGEWNGIAGYYKVILKDNNDDLYQIIRNHRYIVTVVRASGVGSSTIEEAVESETSNIVIEITDANDELHFIYADATRELAVSDNVVKLFHNASYSGANVYLNIVIATIFATPDNSLSLMVSSYVPGFSGAILSPQPDGTYQLRGTFSSTTGSGRITLTYGKLTHTIDVISSAATWVEGEGQAVIYPTALLEAANKPWTANVSTPYYRINNVYDPAAHYNSNGFDSYGYTYLDSSNSDGAWVYSVKNSTGTIGLIDVSYMDSGSFKKGTVMIFPY